MSKRASVVLATGVFTLFGVVGTAMAASAAEVPGTQPVLSSSGTDSPSPTTPSPSVTPSPSEPTPSGSPSATPSTSPSVTLTVSPSATPTASPTVSTSVTPTTSPSPTPTVSPSVTPPAVITAEQARSIALAASGGGTVTKFELKDDHREYRVEIRNGRVEHRIRIDAVSGRITRHDVK